MHEIEQVLPTSTESAEYIGKDRVEHTSIPESQSPVGSGGIPQSWTPGIGGGDSKFRI